MWRLECTVNNCFYCVVSSAFKWWTWKLIGALDASLQTTLIEETKRPLVLLTSKLKLPIFFSGVSPKSSSMEALLENKHSTAQCPQCLISNCLYSAVLSFPILSQIIVEVFCGHGCSSTPRLLPAPWTLLSSSSACLSRSDWLHPHPVQSGDILIFLLPSFILHFVQRHEFASISK